jgi:hypothetical protein
LRRQRLYRAGFALALVVLAAGLALGAAHGDSITVDEPIHLFAGYAALAQGDFRLSPEHPPLARMWAALPLLLVDPRWPPAEAAGWRGADYFDLARDWLERWNDGGRLIAPARAMMVVLLAALCLATAEAARRLLGGAAGVLALFVAALDPTLLAHGHYVTTDLPAALSALLVLLTGSRLLAAPTPGRLGLAALALGAASLVKFSWFLLLPALGVAAILAVFSPRLAPGLPPGRAARTGVVASLAVALAAAVGLAIWAAYGFTYRPAPRAIREGDPERLPVVLLHPAPAAEGDVAERGVAEGGAAAGLAAAGIANPGRPRLPATAAERWEAVLRDPADGRRLAGLPRLVAFARDHRLLPEPYLYGMAYAYRKSLYRSAYLMGRYSTTGWRSYFPLAFALKTPLPTLLLLAAGLAALCRKRKERTLRGDSAGNAPGEISAPWQAGGDERGPGATSGGASTRRPPGGDGYGPGGTSGGASTRRPPGGDGYGPGATSGGASTRRPPGGDGLLAAGLIAFAAVYAGAAIASRLDIGQRHLLPLYPAVFVGAGAAIGWLPGRGRLPAAAIAAAGLWLLAGIWLAFPGYLGYFNELAGGARNGYLYLSDSNVDWGQDLLRLADYARRHPGETIRLAQFGPVPIPRGFSPRILLDGPAGAPLSPLDAGTYAVSATELAGVYHPLVRDESWRHPGLRAFYSRLAAAAAAGRLSHTPAAARGFDLLRRLRLLNGLRHRRADGRVGTSLFLFRLGPPEVAALTRP